MAVPADCQKTDGPESGASLWRASDRKVALNRHFRKQPQPPATKKRCPTPLSAGYVLLRLFPIVNRRNQQKMLENPDPTISYPTGKLSCKFNTAQCQLCQVALPTFRGISIKTNAHMRED
jgi:hypothetical protein